jgi:hypothetical protein
MSGWRHSAEFQDAHDMDVLSQQKTLEHAETVEDIVYLLDSFAAKFPTVRLRQPYIEVLFNLIQSCFGFDSQNWYLFIIFYHCFFMLDISWIDTVPSKYLLKLLDFNSGMLIDVIHFSEIRDAVYSYPLARLPVNLKKLLTVVSNSKYPQLLWLRKQCRVNGPFVEMTLSQWFWVAFAHKLYQKANSLNMTRSVVTNFRTYTTSFFSAKVDVNLFLSIVCGI